MHSFQDGNLNLHYYCTDGVGELRFAGCERCDLDLDLLT